MAVGRISAFPASYSGEGYWRKKTGLQLTVITRTSWDKRSGTTKVRKRKVCDGLQSKRSGGTRFNKLLTDDGRHGGLVRVASDAEHQVQEFLGFAFPLDELHLVGDTLLKEGNLGSLCIDWPAATSYTNRALNFRL